MPIRTTVAAVLVMLGASSIAVAMPAQSAPPGSAMSQDREHPRDGRPMTDRNGINQNGSAARDANMASMDHVLIRQYRRNSRAQYLRDRRAYVRAVMARNHHRAMNRYDRRVMRQQNAYAAAMATWRRNASACRHGDHRACRAPTPRVADFY